VLALAAAAWIAATGLASANTSGHLGKLVLKSQDPATVSGSGFRAHKRVRVTFVSTRTFVRRPMTNSLGRFTTTFPTAIDRCTAFSVTASQPGRATVVLRGGAKPACAPMSTQ
jgi:hypothetical protein